MLKKDILVIQHLILQKHSGYNLKEAGLDVLTTANNHSLDTGYKGIESTLNYLDTMGFSHTGSARSLDEQYTPLILNVNGLKIAFLAFTYGTNGISVPSGKEYCINLTSDELITDLLNNVKKENPDIICCSMHWGIEYEMVPNDNQKELEDLLFNNGVDIIFGSHPHVVQTAEQKTITVDGKEKNVYCIYSLGNFVSGQVKNYTKTGMMINLKITKNGQNGLLNFDEINYIPVYTYTKTGNTHGYKVLDMQKAVTNYENGENNISSSYYETFKSELDRLSKMYNTEF